MRFLALMQPRDARDATRASYLLTAFGIGAAAPLVFVTRPGESLPAHAAVCSFAALGLLAAAVLSFQSAKRSPVLSAILPFLTVACIVVVDLLNRDKVLTSQIFFLYPALWAASQLRRYGAITVCAAVLVGDLIVVVTLLPPVLALTDMCYLGAAIIATTWLLVRSTENQDALVEQLTRLAATDPLTGLVTRRTLDQAMSGSLDGSTSSHGTALILIDVDHFKQVNDRYGHPAGDEVLVQLAALLSHATRPVDLVSRIGGDELAVLLTDCTVQIATNRAERIVRDVRAHTFEVMPGLDIPVTISVGVAHSPTHADDLRSLYAAADASLYTAKRAGRDQLGVPGRHDQHQNPLWTRVSASKNLPVNATASRSSKGLQV